jgi:hypothetical protein
VVCAVWQTDHDVHMSTIEHLLDEMVSVIQSIKDQLPNMKWEVSIPERQQAAVSLVASMLKSPEPR